VANSNKKMSTSTYPYLP